MFGALYKHRNPSSMHEILRKLLKKFPDQFALSILSDSSYIQLRASTHATKYYNMLNILQYSLIVFLNGFRSRDVAQVNGSMKFIPKKIDIQKLSSDIQKQKVYINSTICFEVRLKSKDITINETGRWTSRFLNSAQMFSTRNFCWEEDVSNIKMVTTNLHTFSFYVCHAYNTHKKNTAILTVLTTLLRMLLCLLFKTQQ